MSSTHRVSRDELETRQRLEKKLAAFFASAGFVGAAAISSDANAAIVSSGPLSIKFGPANGGPGNIDIPIDLDGEGELEFMLRHRTNSNSEDFLELDKSPDENSVYPDVDGDGDNGDWAYAVDTLGDYPVALTKGTFGGTVFDPPPGLQYELWQDSSDYQGDFVDPKYIRRANRLIDYDSGVDELTDANNIWSPPPSPPGNFVGLGGVPHYVGVQMDFDDDGPFYYGWIGVKITDDATASGELIGYAYNTVPARGLAIGHYVPEPTTMAMAGLGGVVIASALLGRRLRDR